MAGQLLKENGGIQFRMAELRTSGEGEVGGCARLDLAGAVLCRCWAGTLLCSWVWYWLNAKVVLRCTGE